MPEESKDRALVEKLAFSALVEQRAKRRWGVFFKLLIVGYVIALSVYVIIQSKFEPSAKKEHVAVISISGPIIDEGPNSALAVNRQLRLAFEDEKAKGVILRINSPGGSAVESNRIFQEIRRLRKKYAEKKYMRLPATFALPAVILSPPRPIKFMLTKPVYSAPSGLFFPVLVLPVRWKNWAWKGAF